MKTKAIIKNDNIETVDVSMLNRLNSDSFYGTVRVDFKNGESFEESGAFTSDYYSELGIKFE